MVSSFSCVWSPLDNAEDSYLFFCLGKLVWEALVNYLEYDTSLSTVVCLVGRNNCIFEDNERSRSF